MPFKSKQEQLKYLAEYRKKNKDTILARRKRRVRCACGTVCSWNSLGRHRKTKGHMLFEEKNGGKTIKDYVELTCIVIESEEEEEAKTETVETPKNVIVEPKEPKPIWKQYCKNCGNAIENHSIKRLISCGLVDNTKTIEFLTENIKN